MFLILPLVTILCGGINGKILNWGVWRSGALPSQLSAGISKIGIVFKTFPVVSGRCGCGRRRQRPRLLPAPGAAKRSVALYGNEKDVRGHRPDEPACAGPAQSKPLFDAFQVRLKQRLAGVSAKTPLAGAMRSAMPQLKRLRPCLENGLAERDYNGVGRAIRGIALGRKNWLFAGSERGGKSAAIAYT